MFTLYYQVNKAKEMSNNEITLGLARIGHTFNEIDRLETFRVDDQKFIALVVSELFDEENLAAVTDRLSEFADIELIETNDHMHSLHHKSLAKGKGTDLRLWFDRDTYTKK